MPTEASSPAGLPPSLAIGGRIAAADQRNRAIGQDGGIAQYRDHRRRIIEQGQQWGILRLTPDQELIAQLTQ